MDKFEENLREILAQSKHKSSGAERFVRASLAENKYPKDFLIYFINSECFGDYESEIPAYETWNYQQAKVEELQKQLSEYIFVAETIDEMYVKEVQKSDELQKRVQFLEQELGAWKGKSIAAMINGMCKQCGKEPWQAIRSDKDGYALLHCFGCGANKYELVGEQALNGDQYDEHRKKAEEAISKGASLTNHRIEL
ncbi:hypothetical protein [Acinetobacter baumannii]|uniref:hypothetical protein n=1 Tax=Acinetobacter baumannii TaxID=470 RepID=UPI00387E54B5